MSHRVDWQIFAGLLLSSSGSSSPKTVLFLYCPTLKKESEFWLETAATIYQLIGSHILKKSLIFYQHNCERLKFLRL